MSDEKIEQIIARQELLDRKLNLALGMLDAVAGALSELAAAFKQWHADEPLHAHRKPV